MTYTAAEQYLYSQLPMFHRIGKAAYKANLDNITHLCEGLEDPQQQFKSIHVAGTNGKGSTSHMLAAILQSAGYKVGLFTSPHLKSFRERIKLNGQWVEEDFVIDFVQNYQAKFSSLQASFFEVTTAMAFSYFAQKQVDIAIIEVGLGGRLDSTNIITPQLAVITNISYDHQTFLGDTLPQIATEKAGIIKSKIPVVISEKQPEIASVFEVKAQEMEAPLHWGEEMYQIHAKRYEKQQLYLDIYQNQEIFLTQLAPQLVGIYQTKNIVGVLAAVEILNAQGIFKISKEAIKQGIQQTITLTGLKGRWQILENNPLVVCDTAHNEGGIKQIVQQISLTPHQKLLMLIAAMDDKDLSKILPLYPKNAYYYFCQPQLPRAMDAHLLADKAKQYGLEGEVIQDVNQALNHAKQKAKQEDMICICGSTFLVAEVDGL